MLSMFSNISNDVRMIILRLIIAQSIVFFRKTLLRYLRVLGVHEERYFYHRRDLFDRFYGFIVVHLYFCGQRSGSKGTEGGPHNERHS